MMHGSTNIKPTHTVRVKADVISKKKQYLPQDSNLHSLCSENLEPLEGKSRPINYTSHQDALCILTLRATPCLTVFILAQVPVPSELNNNQVEAFKL